MQPFNKPSFVLIESDATHVTSQKATTACDFAAFQVRRMAGLHAESSGFQISSLSSPVAVGKVVGDMRDSPGEWMAIAEKQGGDAGEYIVFSDAYGYGPVFYALVPRVGLVVSDSFQGLVSGLKKFNFKLTLNLAYYATVISSKAPQFQNLPSNQTMANEISVLDNQCILYVQDLSIEILSRYALGGASASTDYDQALAQGRNLSDSVLQGICQADDTENRLTLSGGVDSRLALSLLTSAGVERRFKVNSMDPRIWPNANTSDVIERDVVIADQIRKDFGLDWWDGGSKSSLSIDFLESLASFQSYRSNYAYTFRPSSLHSMFDQKLLSVRGGGGEILRSTSGGSTMDRSISNEFTGEQEKLKNGAAWLATRYLKSSNLIDEYKESAHNLIAQSFQELDGETFEERMNAYYFRFRNRSHFGHSRFALASNDFTLQVLSNPYFLQASKLIPFKERANGRLVSDLFNKTNAKLLRYTFENPVWTEKLGRHPRIEINLNTNNWSHSYDAAAAPVGPTNFVPGWARGSRNEFYNFAAEQSSLNYIKRGFEAIESSVSADERATLAIQHSRVLQSIRRNALNIHQTVAKVASAIDVFFAQSADREVVRYSSLPRPRLRREQITISLHYPNVPQNGWHDMPVFEQSATIQRLENGFRIKTSVNGTTTQLMSYAFYLHLNGKKIMQQWYGDDTSAEFITDNEPGTYSGIAFARPKNSDSPSYQFETRSITIP